MNIALVPSEVRHEKLKQRQETFEQWMTEYEDAVLRMCFLYLKDRAYAQDATQETFLKVWLSMDKFERRNNCTAKTWIMQIAINTCIDHNRSAWVRYVVKEKEPDLSWLHVSDQERQKYLLFQAILDLPDKYKKIVLLYYYQNMTMAETAYALGIARPTLSKRLKEAYGILREVLDGSDLYG